MTSTICLSPAITKVNKWPVQKLTSFKEYLIRLSRNTTLLIGEFKEYNTFYLEFQKEYKTYKLEGSNFDSCGRNFCFILICVNSPWRRVDQFWLPLLQPADAFKEEMIFT